MPVQIQGDVVAEYTEVITVATTGEVLTEAQIYDTALALANRTEYVRALSPEATEAPEAFAILRDEFWGAIWDSEANRMTADLVWRTDYIGLPFVTGTGGTPKNPGQLSIVLPPGENVFEASVQSLTGDPFSFATIEQLQVVVKITEHVDNVNHVTSFGLVQEAGADSLNGGTDCLQIFRQVSTSATKWQLLRRVASAQTITELTAADFADGQFAVWKMRRQSSGDVVISLNGATVHTVAAADLPADNCSFRFFTSNSSGDTEITSVAWDLVAIRSNPDDRSGA